MPTQAYCSEVDDFREGISTAFDIIHDVLGAKRMVSSVRSELIGNEASWAVLVSAYFVGPDRAQGLISFFCPNADCFPEDIYNV